MRYRIKSLYINKNVGKTFLAIIAIKRIIRDENPNVKVGVCVPSDYLRNKWKETLNSFSIPFVIVDTVHMLNDKDLSDLDILVLDEIHRYVGDTAEVFPNIFKTISDDCYILGLTATLGSNGIRLDLIEKYCPVVDTVSLEEALREGYISNYVEYNFAISLPRIERMHYDKLDRKFGKYFATFKFDFDLAKKCLDQEFAEQYAKELKWEPDIVKVHAFQFFRAMRERKEYLYSAPSKLRVTEEIIKSFPDRKIITFSQETKIADQLDEIFEDGASYHSNLGTILVDKISQKQLGEKKGKKYEIYNEGLYTWNEIKLKFPNVKRIGAPTRLKEILNGFIEGKYKYLFTAKKLDEGLDNDDIDFSIIISGSSRYRQHVQRIGRSLNKKEGKLSIIVHLYITDTQDEKWLSSRQLETDVRTITRISDIQI